MKNKTFLTITSIIVLFIIVPLLKPGYIFALDQVINPNGWIPNIGSHNYWVALLSQLFAFLHIPIWILEKLLVLVTFLAPSIGIYLLLWWKNKSSHISSWILFWILLIICNPFLYSRFLDGQINVYLSYSFYPLFFYFLHCALTKAQLKHSLILWLWSLLLCLTSIHNAIFLTIIWCIFFICYYKKCWVKALSKIAIFPILFNLLWITPFLFFNIEKASLSTQINQFWTEHQQAFETFEWSWNIYFNTLSMHWYWWENQPRFLTTDDFNPYYQGIFIILFLIVIAWIYSQIRSKKYKNFDHSLTLLAITSFILALGNSQWNIFSPVSNFLYEYLPFYKGFREPHKWVIFLVIFYSYFGSHWINYMWDIIIKYKNYKKILQLFGYLLVLIPLFYTYQMIWGFWWQVSISHYPSQWQQVKSTLNTHTTLQKGKWCSYLLTKKSTTCYSTLSLPWHWYIHIRYANKVVGWWIVQYFWNNILYWDTLEYAWIYSQSNRPESKIIEKYIWPSWLFKKAKKDIPLSDIQLFITDVTWLWIKHIIFLHESDFWWYKDFLELWVEKKYLTIEEQNKMLTLYKILPSD